jgi:hypothetical protein
MPDSLERCCAIDSRVHEDGVLPAKTRELLGFAAAVVQRCDDHFTYRVIRCREEGVSDPEFYDAFVALPRSWGLDRDSAPAARRGPHGSAAGGVGRPLRFS